MFFFVRSHTFMEKNERIYKDIQKKVNKRSLTITTENDSILEEQGQTHNYKMV